jgi:hypothetical protein
MRMRSFVLLTNRFVHYAFVAGVWLRVNELAREDIEGYAIWEGVTGVAHLHMQVLARHTYGF